MMIQTQRLEYSEHTEEINTLNKILATVQANYPSGYPAEMHPAIALVLSRLDQLTSAEKATLRPYDQHESRT